MTTTSPSPTTIQRRWSRPLVAAASAALLIGIISGGIQYLTRSPAHRHHSTGTAAWPVHIVLAVALLITSLARGWSLPATLTTTAAARLRTAARQTPARLVLAAPLIALVLYNLWRVGEQVLAGLDPNFTVNAWGGPTYLGAMFCHYLDAALLTAAVLILIDWLLPKPGPSR